MEYRLLAGRDAEQRTEFYAALNAPLQSAGPQAALRRALGV